MINNKYMVVTKFGFRKKKNQNKSGLVAHKTQPQHPIDKMFLLERYLLYLHCDIENVLLSFKTKKLLRFECNKIR